MKTKFELKKTWISSLEIMRKNPIVMLPFIFIGFLECLSLELIFFSTRRPISYITIPIYMKFLGPGATRYPGNLVHLPKLFYYAQLAIYVLFGVLMTAVCVNMVRNIRQGLPPG